jgi:hypothetical protein
MSLPKVRPTDALVSELLEKLPDSLVEAWEEKAAVVEFDGMSHRAHAECLALLDVLSRYPDALIKGRHGR